jgi:hypothetical protein
MNTNEEVRGDRSLFHSRKRQPGERDRAEMGFVGGTFCPQRVGKRKRQRRRIFAPSATIAIVFGEADPTLAASSHATRVPPQL